MRRAQRRYVGLGADEAPFSVEATLRAHSAELERLNKTAERELLYRKIAAAAAVAGALFAAVRLTDIWLAVRRRRA